MCMSVCASICVYRDRWRYICLSLSHFASCRKADEPLQVSLAGSLAYMAPEVCGRKGYSWQVDWWSLGVVAWELLFRRRPFEGRTAREITYAITKETPRMPEKAADMYSDDCLKALRMVSPHKSLLSAFIQYLGSSLIAIPADAWGVGLCKMA